ncbi:hypothetical protein CJF32_00003788 [Rutstroemia sp. NJR-2017a WRK4]|nr:hypothetical protein CJF32_00003788 [Rutstroemia sp. NJR-2017a WRK4]
MAPTKRPREDSTTTSSTPRALKKPRPGFRVGPANLPDGTWKRKVDKIKATLIHKAKVKKSYAKIKAQEQEHGNLGREQKIYETLEQEDDVGKKTQQQQELHPDRKAMLDAPEEAEEEDRAGERHRNRRGNNGRGNKPAYFAKEIEIARRQKEEREAKQAEFERRQREIAQKREERERFRRQMAKARSGGKNGQRKLGRESKVLLERVKKIVEV